MYVTIKEKICHYFHFIMTLINEDFQQCIVYIATKSL